MPNEDQWSEPRFFPILPVYDKGRFYGTTASKRYRTVVGCRKGGRSPLPEGGFAHMIVEGRESPDPNKWSGLEQLQLQKHPLFRARQNPSVYPLCVSPKPERTPLIKP